MQAFNKGDVVIYKRNYKDESVVISDIGIVTAVHMDECLVKFSNGEDLFEKADLMLVVRAPKS